MIRVHLTIIGTVQGVYFRQHALNKARYLRVKGWVANELDGTVSVVAEGEENKINQLIDWCSSGPSTAHVEKVKVENEPYMREFEDFQIRY